MSDPTQPREQPVLCTPEEMNLILGSVSSLLLRTDAEGCVTAWSDRARELLEIDPEARPGTRLDQLSRGWDEEVVQDAVARCLTREEVVRIEELPVEGSDHRRRYLGMTLNPIVGEGGLLRGCLILGRDITEHKQVELQLVQAQKLEAMGQLAAGVAHEINTPMQFVGDNVRFLRDIIGKLRVLLEACAQWSTSLSTGSPDAGAATRMLTGFKDMDFDYLAEEGPQAVEDALKGIDRVSSIVRAMKSLSYVGSGEKEPVDLNQALQDTVTVAAHEWKSVAAVELDLQRDLPPVSCLPGEINQVFLNMLVNAVHAIEDAGRAGSGAIRLSTRRQGDAVVVRIRDNGCGLPEGMRARIFDPFFTTKEVGRGTGQGLSISHAVVHQKHGGCIEVDSEPGQWTEFSIRLPIEAVAVRRAG